MGGYWGEGVSLQMRFGRLLKAIVSFKEAQGLCTVNDLFLYFLC